MDFEEIYINFINNEGKYFGNDNKIYNNYKDNSVKIPFIPFSIDIYSSIQAIDYILENFDDNTIEKNIIISSKSQLVNLLNDFKKNELTKKQEKKHNENVTNIYLKIYENIIEHLGKENIEEYFSAVNYANYVKKWCDENKIYFEINSYFSFLRKIKYKSRIYTWQKAINVDINKYKKIIGLKIPNNSEFFYIDYKESMDLVKDEQIIINIENEKKILSEIEKNENWIKYINLNPKTREKLCEINYDYYDDFYLMFNNTLKKYNYYENETKNEIIVFRYHKYNNQCVIYINKFIF